MLVPQPEQEKAAGRRPRSHGSHGSDTSTDSSNDSIAFSPSTSAAAAGSTGRGKEQRSGGSSIGHNNNCTTSMKTSPSPGPVFYGPTTRRAWKEQTSEPVSIAVPCPAAVTPYPRARQSKQVSASAPQDSGSGPEQNGKNGGAGSERHAEKETPAKCADKWTCRKQAKERQPSDRTAASSGNEENENQAVTANLTTGNQKKQRGRPRKDASGVAAAAAKAVRRASKNGAVKVPGVVCDISFRLFLPGATIAFFSDLPDTERACPTTGSATQKEDGCECTGKRLRSLSVCHTVCTFVWKQDTLHEQTLLSIHNRSGKRLSPAPGCVDTLLVSKLSGEQQEPHTGVPSVIIADSSDLSVK